MNTQALFDMGVSMMKAQEQYYKVTARTNVGETMNILARIHPAITLCLSIISLAIASSITGR